MFISMPKEFFVPVVFGEGFILNEENDHLELDLSRSREISNKKNEAKTDITKNKEYLEKSKSSKEKQDIVEVEVEVKMDEKQCGNKTENVIKKDEYKEPQVVKPQTNTKTEESINKESETTIYMSLKDSCKEELEKFKALDDEFIENIEIKGCNEKE